MTDLIDLLEPSPPEPSGVPRGDADVRAFDDEHPPARDLLDDCVHCGFCLPACPTYELWGEEMDSPRGRILLMDRAERGEIGLTAETVSHLDACLGCMACVPACPSGVRYDRLIEDARQQVERRFERPLGERLAREAAFAFLPHPRLLRAAAVPLRLYERTGAAQSVRSARLVDRISPRLGRLDRLAPPAPPVRARRPAVYTPAVGGRRLRVALVTGCVQDAFFSHVNADTARVLAAWGCDVVATPGQGCCGALELHAGRRRQSLGRARQLIERLERIDADRIVINAAGCGSTLKEYGVLLSDDTAWAARATSFSSRVRDVHELLVELGSPRVELRPGPPVVAYHDACHLANAQGVRAEPRALLASIPGTTVVEVPRNGTCCGSAGVYNLFEPEAADALGRRKAEDVRQTGASVLAAANPGCLIQIAAFLQDASVELRHPMELLAAALPVPA